MTGAPLVAGAGGRSSSRFRLELHKGFGAMTATWVLAETTEWAVNADGYTYGVINENGEPDLIAVMTTDNQPGYVWRTDLNDANGTTAAESFTSPEDALRWQEANAGVVRHIPVYESDGTTQIGAFQVGGN